MNRLPWMVTACFLACNVLPAAPPEEISGTVIDADTGKPISRARVAATIWIATRLGHPDVLVALTDDDGYFHFTGLPKGQCEVSAQKFGYEREIRINTFLTRPGDESEPQTISLTPTGWLTVRVSDESGAPVEGAQVAIVRRGQENEPFLINLSIAWSTTAKDGTRTVPVSRGSYAVVVVSPGSGNLLRARGQTFLPTYYPGTTSASLAQPIDVVPGKEVRVEVGVTPIPARQIRGRIGFAGTLVQAAIRPTGDTAYDVMWGLPRVSQDTGEFRVVGLTPGLYDLDVSVCLEVPCMSATIFRKTVRVIDADIDNLVISDADRWSGK